MVIVVVAQHEVDWQLQLLIKFLQPLHKAVRFCDVSGQPDPIRLVRPHQVYQLVRGPRGHVVEMNIGDPTESVHEDLSGKRCLARFSRQFLNISWHSVSRQVLTELANELPAPLDRHMKVSCSDDRIQLM